MKLRYNAHECFIQWSNLRTIKFYFLLGKSQSGRFAFQITFDIPLNQHRSSRNITQYFILFSNGPIASLSSKYEENPYTPNTRVDKRLAPREKCHARRVHSLNHSLRGKELYLLYKRSLLALSAQRERIVISREAHCETPGAPDYSFPAHHVLLGVVTCAGLRSATAELGFLFASNKQTSLGSGKPDSSDARDQRRSLARALLWHRVGRLQICLSLLMDFDSSTRFRRVASVLTGECSGIRLTLEEVDFCESLPAKVAQKVIQASPTIKHFQYSVVFFFSKAQQFFVRNSTFFLWWLTISKWMVLFSSAIV